MRRASGNYSGRGRRRLLSSGGVIPPPQLAFANPVIAGLGGSRIRQAGIGLTGTAHQITGGSLTWAKALEPRLRFTAWFDDTGEQNSNGLNGLLFANDGQGFTSMYNRLPKLLSSDAQIVLVDLSSNSIQFNDFDIAGNDLGTAFSVAGYTALAKQIIAEIRRTRPDMLIVVQSAVERNSAAGGPWGIGQNPRKLVPAINAEMQAWIAVQQGVVYADIRSVLVDLADPNFEPRPEMVRDGTHWSPRGSYVSAKVILAGIQPHLTGSAKGSFASGPNVLPPLTGALSPATGVAISGDMPAGWSLTRFGATSAATIAVSRVEQGGKAWLRFLIDTAAMGPSDQEGFALQPSASAAVTQNAWYAGSAEIDVKAFDAWLLTGQVGIAGATGLSGQNGGGTPISAPAAGVLRFPAEAYKGRVETFAGKASGATAQPSFRVMWQKGSGIAEILIADLELAPTSDPLLIMSNEADTTPLQFTSPAALTTPEGVAPAFQMTTNKPYARWSLSGPDAALFTINRYGLLQSTAVLDFEAPADADANNAYQVTVTATPFNPALPAVALPLTITVTDVNDGFTDNFSRAAGELGTNGDGWTKVVTGTGSVAVTANGRAGVPAGGLTRSTYAAPKQGDTHEQRVTYTATTTTASPANSPVFHVQWIDDANRVTLRHDSSANQLVLGTTIGGVGANYNVPLWTALAVGQRIMAQRLGDSIEVYQNDVLVLRQPIGAVLRQPSLSAISNGAAAYTLGFADAWNNRLASDYSATAKVALRALTVTPTTGTTTADYQGAINNRTAGSEVALRVVSGPGGSWIADGTVIRGTGLAAGTHQLELAETHPRAANNDRKSTVSVTVS